MPSKYLNRYNGPGRKKHLPRVVLALGLAGLAVAALTLDSGDMMMLVLGVVLTGLGSFR